MLGLSDSLGGRRVVSDPHTARKNGEACCSTAGGTTFDTNHEILIRSRINPATLSNLIQSKNSCKAFLTSNQEPNITTT
jgi:hypothetical protein